MLDSTRTFRPLYFNYVKNAKVFVSYERRLYSSDFMELTLWLQAIQLAFESKLNKLIKIKSNLWITM